LDDILSGELEQVCVEGTGKGFGEECVGPWFGEEVWLDEEPIGGMCKVENQ